jgi:hypothetical protein
MKNIFLSVLFLLFSVSAFGIVSPTLNTAQPRLSPDPDFKYAFDNLQGVPAARKYKLGTVLWQAHNTAVCVYDFATQGGAIGNINLLNEDLKTPCTLPGKAVVRNGFIDTNTAVTSGGSATISLSTGQAAADLLAATGKASFSTGELAIIPVVGTVSTYIKLTTANSIVSGVNLYPYQVYATVAVAALTAGHFRLFIDYARGE